jgi:hypothetical protein
MGIAETAQEILKHASSGPSAAPGQRVRNSLSPHFERLVIELIRKHLIAATREAQATIGKELDSLRSITPDHVAQQVEFTGARINAILQSLIK